MVSPPQHSSPLPIPVAPHAALTVIEQVQRQTGGGALLGTVVFGLTSFFAFVIAGISKHVSMQALLVGLAAGLPATWFLFRGLRSGQEAESLRQAKTLGPGATGELLGQTLTMREGQRFVTLHLSRGQCARIRQLALPQAVAKISD